MEVDVMEVDLEVRRNRVNSLRSDDSKDEANAHFFDQLLNDDIWLYMMLNCYFSAKDLLNLTTVCKKFYYLVQNDQIWKSMSDCDWSYLKGSFQINEKDTNLWKDKYRLYLAEHLKQQHHRQMTEGFSSLHEAAFTGRYSRLISVLHQQTAIQPENHNTEHSPLPPQTQSGSNEVSNSSNVNGKTNDGRTALHCAAQNGFVGIVKALLEFNADVNITCTNGMTPMHVAAKFGHANVIKALLQSKGVDVNQKDTILQATPLYTAAFAGHVDVTNALIRADADINLPNKNGTTPLFVAAQEGHLALCTILIDYGANVNACKHTDGASPLFVAAEKGHTGVVQLLIKHGALINTPKHSGATPLLMASQNGHTDVVSLLINHGASVNTARNDGATPLLMAVCNGHCDVVKVLVENHTVVNNPWREGATALFYAAQEGFTSIVKLLLQHGADKKMMWKGKVTPLQIAKQEGHHEVAELLATSEDEEMTDVDE